MLFVVFVTAFLVARFVAERCALADLERLVLFVLLALVFVAGVFFLVAFLPARVLVCFARFFEAVVLECSATAFLVFFFAFLVCLALVVFGEVIVFLVDFKRRRLFEDVFASFTAKERFATPSAIILIVYRIEEIIQVLSTNVLEKYCRARWSI